MGAKRHIFAHPFWILIFCLRSISYIPPWMSAWKRLLDVRFWNFQWSLSLYTTWRQRIKPPEELSRNRQAKIILNIRCKLTRKQSCNQSSGRAWCGVTVKFLKVAQSGAEVKCPGVRSDEEQEWPEHWQSAPERAPVPPSSRLVPPSSSGKALITTINK